MTSKNELSASVRNELIESMNDERLIIFVGAGVSKNSGVPDWGELIESFKKDLPGITENDPLKIAQIYFSKFGEEKYRKKIHSIFGDMDRYEPNLIHKKISQINPIHIITTNYDYLLEKELNKNKDCYSVIAADPDTPEANPKHVIIKMHGDFKHENFVLKEDDYQSYADTFPRLTDRIKTYLADFNILYIGYGWNDSTFKGLWDTVFKSFGRKSKTHFFFSPSKLDEYETSYYENMGIQVIPGKLNPDEIRENGGSEIEEFLSILIEGKEDAGRAATSKERVPLFESNQVNNEKDLWTNIEFFTSLNYVESQDILKYANISEWAMLYPSDEVIYRSENGKEIQILQDEELYEFLESKTSISEFLGQKITHPNDEEFNCAVNEVLYPGFEKYEEKDYLGAINAFQKISTLALEKKDYWNFFIAEFNVRHIVVPFGQENSKSSSSTTLEKTIDDILMHGSPSERRLAIFFREEIHSFGFVYRKLFKINNLLDRVRKERLNFKRGGSSTNNNLWTVQYEFYSLMTFVQKNCITIYQYEEFRQMVTRYFECLVIALDNSNYQRNRDVFFSNTSSIISEFSEYDTSSIVPFITSKDISVILESYDLRKIPLSNEASSYLIDRIMCQKNDLLKNYSYEKMNDLTNDIDFFSNTDTNENKTVIDILEGFPIYQVNVNQIRQLLTMLVNLTKKSDDVEAKRITSIIDMHLRLVLKNKCHVIYSDNFHLYEDLLKRYQEEDRELLVLSSLEFLDILDYFDAEEAILQIENFRDYIIHFYRFFNDSLKDKLNELFRNYEKLEDDEFNVYFAQGVMLNGIYEFRKKHQLFIEHWKNAIVSPTDPNIITYPDPKKSAIRDVYRAQKAGYFTSQELDEAIGYSNMKGFIPEIDWLLFDIHTSEIAEKLLEKFTYQRARELFGKTDEELKIWDSWLSNQVKNGNVRFDQKKF
ncbi:SIR2 family protein [Lactovum odontotermitis]